MSVSPLYIMEGDRLLNKILAAVMTAGIVIAFFFGFQWWSSIQAVEEVPLEEIEQWDQVKDAPSMEKQTIERKEKPPVYTEDLETFKQGDEVGRVIIPKLEKGFKVYWGADEESLKRGVGMYVSQWTTTPKEQRHTVLSGHRETVFTGLGEVEEGDSIFVEFQNKRYEYRVAKTWVTDAKDRTVIVDKDEPVLTLTTCYPFEFVGDAPDRYIIEATLESVNKIE